MESRLCANRLDDRTIEQHDYILSSGGVERRAWVIEAHEIKVKLVGTAQVLWATQLDHEQPKLIRPTVRLQMASREADRLSDRKSWLVAGIPQTRILQFRLRRAPSHRLVLTANRNQQERTRRCGLAVHENGKTEDHQTSDGEMLKALHSSNEKEISHGRVSWQTRWTYFEMGPLTSSIG